MCNDRMTDQLAEALEDLGYALDWLDGEVTNLMVAVQDGKYSKALSVLGDMPLGAVEEALGAVEDLEDERKAAA